MATFDAKPRILLEVTAPTKTVRELDAHLGGAFERAWVTEAKGGMVVDCYLVTVDVAEKAVAWLKEHDVERAT